MLYNLNSILNDINNQREWIDIALVYMKRFMSDPHFYTNLVKKAFFDKYISRNGFYKQKTFLNDVKKYEEILTSDLHGLEMKQQSLAKQLKLITGDDSKALKQQLINCTAEIKRLQALLKQNITPDMLENSHESFSDYEILHWVCHYVSATNNRTPVGALAAMMEENYKKYLEGKHKLKWTAQEKLYNLIANVFAQLNYCGNFALKAVLPVIESKEYSEEECIFNIDNYLKESQKCFKDLTELSNEINKVVNKYYKEYPEMLTLEKLKDPQAERVDILIMNLINEQTEKLKELQEKFKQLEQPANNIDVVVPIKKLAANTVAVKSL